MAANDARRRTLSANLAFDVSSMLGLNRYRSAHASIGRGYVEGFLMAPAPQWFALARSVRDGGDRP